MLDIEGRTWRVSKAVNENAYALSFANEYLKKMYDPGKKDDKTHTIPDEGGLTHKHPELLFQYYE